MTVTKTLELVVDYTAYEDEDVAAKNYQVRDMDVLGARTAKNQYSLKVKKIDTWLPPTLLFLSYGVK